MTPWINLMIAYRDSSPSDGHQGNLPYIDWTYTWIIYGDENKTTK